MTTLDNLSGAELYLDSNIFIYALEAPEAAAHPITVQLLQDIHDQTCLGATSLLTRAEVLVRPLRERQVALAERYRVLLSGAGAIALYALDADVIELAAKLRADYPALKLPDALHLATAINTDCDAFVTSDKRLNVVSGRIRIVVIDQLTGQI